ncbi:MAG: glycosyltransferase family 4 protein [Elainella sp. Prado103]|jgi:glycosyltransferase involved in cell wall biosynthesis|nr:glycosyltransferase family 4 protein [Elainella sp. Prado103]
MHIAWLGKKSPFCGNVTYGREVTNALLDRGYQVSFLHFAQEEESASGSWREVSRDCPEVPIPFLYKSQIYTIPSLRSSKVLTKALRQLKPDLVHASLTLSPLDFLLPEICEELDIPLVATFHPPFARKPRNLTSGTQQLTYQFYAPFLANYDRVIVFSQIQQDLLIRFGVPQARIAVIPNGVDPDKYSPGLAKLKTQLNAQRIFIYQGRVAIEKNVESLLRAWKQAEMDPQSKLVIVGSGPLTPALMSTYTEEMGVIWMGFVADEQERIQLLRGSDVFILPSLVEGLSLSLLEAMACGLACIATDAGADGEVLEAGAGIVLGTQRVATQLQTLLPIFQDHPEMTTLLGHKARERVLDRYTLSRNITRLEQLYAQVLQQRQIYSSTPV